MAFEKIMDIIWQKEIFRLLPEKAIHWPAEKTLFVADPHFGKSATFRKVGIPISDENSKDDCKKLLTLCENTQVRKIIFLGDFLHARQGRSDSVRKLLGEWRSNCLEIELHLVRGNHDRQSGDPWQELDIRCHDEPLCIKSWHCRHHPMEDPKVPHLAGHLHPGFSIRGKSRTGVRSACFQVSENRIILPAFGSFTGLMEIKPRKGDRIFMTNEHEIVPLPPF